MRDRRDVMRRGGRRDGTALAVARLLGAAFIDMAAGRETGKTGGWGGEGVRRGEAEE